MNEGSAPQTKRRPSHPTTTATRRTLAVMCWGLALIANIRCAGLLLTSDGTIESSRTRMVIYGLQVLLGIAGLILWSVKSVPLPRRRQVLLLCISSLLSIGALEVATRCWLKWLATAEQRSAYCLYTDIAAEDWQWSPHHYLNYYPTPDFQRGLTHHNSLGFRGPQIQVPKPAETFRIAILGGSTTYTIAVEDDQLTFPAQLQKTLTEDFGYSNVEVINAGVGGYNSWESLINLQFRVLDLQPDLVIVYHGTNDVHPRLVDPEIYRSDNSGRRIQWHYPRIAPIEHIAFLRILGRKLGISTQIGLETIVNRDVPVPLSDTDIIQRLNQNPPVYFERNLQMMVALTQQTGARIVLSTWAHSPNRDDYASTKGYQHGFRQNNDVVRKVASQTTSPVFDFAQKMPVEAEFWADGRHVNEAGAALKAGLFAEFLHENQLLTRPAETLTE